MSDTTKQGNSLLAERLTARAYALAAPLGASAMNAVVDSNTIVLLREAASEIARLEAERDALRAAQRWIPVGERLPDEEGRYAILYSHSGKSRLTPFIGDFDPVDQVWRCGLCDESITHWMPLPATPEGHPNNSHSD